MKEGKEGWKDKIRGAIIVLKEEEVVKEV